MFKSKVVFILGAGASYEVGFPLGVKLKSIIATKLDIKFDRSGRNAPTGDSRIYYKLQEKYLNKTSDYINAAWQIRDGIPLSDSIDDFINVHQHDERILVCGKLAIACSILDAEKKSKLYFNTQNYYNTIAFDNLGDTWYSKFYSLITKQVDKKNLDSLFDNITVINFNYDRSLEHFLVHAIAKHYCIQPNESLMLVKKLTVFRPYGIISSSIPYGGEELSSFDNVISGLKTYTEQIEDTKGLNEVKQSIIDADVIIFLGNAYHPNNMNLLQVECINIKNKRIYATSCGISDYDLPVIRRRIFGMLHPLDSTNSTLVKAIQDRINFSDTCYNLFDFYRYSLSEH